MAVEFSAAEDLYGRLAPLAQPDPENGYALQALVNAITAPAEVVCEVVQETDTHRPWEVILDPDNADAVWLPFLAIPAGVQLLPSDSEAQQRARIKAAAGLYAGTVRAIREEVQLVLNTPDAEVRILKTSQWGLTVVVREADAPETDWLVLGNALKNPGAEVNVTDGGWAGNNAAVTRTTGNMQRGAGGFVLTASAAGNMSLRHLSDRFAVTAGDVWSAGAYFKTLTTIRDCRVHLDFYDAASARVGGVTYPGDLIADDPFMHLRAVVEGITVPATAVTGQIIAEVIGAASGEVHFVDSLWAGEAATAPDGNPDGDSRGWHWTGTAHNSASQRTITSKVRDAALRQKPAGKVLTVVISDEPIIDEFTRTIDAITATIDSLTVPDVT
jgi:hypothetical protein